MSTPLKLSWPARVLNPNARVGRYEHSEASRRARATGKAAALEAGLNLLEFAPGEIPLVLVFHFPDDHIRDSDNMLSSCKAYRDGVCEVLAVDDSRFWPVLVARGANVKGGQVVINFGLAALVGALVEQFGIDLVTKAIESSQGDESCSE